MELRETHCQFPAIRPPIELRLTQLGERPCPYLPEPSARDRAFLVDAMPAELYHGFMDAGFRRSGRVVYQPTCRSCRKCQPVRVVTADFHLSKRLRRCANRNADLQVDVGEAGVLKPTREKFELYRRYQAERHGDHQEDWEGYLAFLYASPVMSIEFTYRDAEGRLVAVGICDICRKSLSSVYFYYDPSPAEMRRGLGTFGVLREIEFCQRLDIPHYYLGFYVEGCAAMRYKIEFHPHELLGLDGVWRAGAAEMSATSASSP